MQSDPHILLIYTGGTVGMVKDALTGVLAPFDFNRLKSQIPELNQVRANIDTVAFDTPIDSSNMNLEHWEQMARVIEANYHLYHGFVILHGSDTMAYTAAALSFMLVNLSKPVILTGSQLPIGMVRTDGKENIITAIEIAASMEEGKPLVPEVAIYFEYQLYRGNRTYKYNAEHFEAFRSPNYPILAQAGVHIKFNRSFIRPLPTDHFRVEYRMDNRVALLSLFPGISAHIVKAGLSVQDNKVLIIRTFGSGNAMTYPWFTEALEEAIEGGLIVVNASQCRAGRVDQGRYQTSTHLKRIGVIGSGDMVVEAAIAKSMHLLANCPDRAEFERAFYRDLRGELTVGEALPTA